MGPYMWWHFFAQVEGAFHLADDLPNLRLLGDRGRGQRNGLRGRAHSSQQGPHRRHGWQVNLFQPSRLWHFLCAEEPSREGTGWMPMSLSGLLSSSFILHITVTILLILIIITIICNEKKDFYEFFRLHQPAAYYGVNSRPLENSQVLREIKKII